MEPRRARANARGQIALTNRHKRRLVARRRYVDDGTVFECHANLRHAKVIRSGPPWRCRECNGSAACDGGYHSTALWSFNVELNRLAAITVCLRLFAAIEFAIAALDWLNRLAQPLDDFLVRANRINRRRIHG